MIVVLAPDNNGSGLFSYVIKAGGRPKMYVVLVMQYAPDGEASSHCWLVLLLLYVTGSSQAIFSPASKKRTRSSGIFPRTPYANGFSRWTPAPAPPPAHGESQLCKALDYIACKRIIHRYSIDPSCPGRCLQLHVNCSCRDVKLANVLIGSDGRLLLLLVSCLTCSKMATTSSSQTSASPRSLSHVASPPDLRTLPGHAWKVRSDHRRGNAVLHGTAGDLPPLC